MHCELVVATFKEIVAFESKVCMFITQGLNVHVVQNLFIMGSTQQC